MLSMGAISLGRACWILSITHNGPRYDSTALESHLASVLGDVSLSAVENVQLLVPSYAIALPKEDPPGNTCAPMFFRSWQARGLLVPAGANAAEYDFKLASIARATSAAPTYFASGIAEQAMEQARGAADIYF